MEEELLLVDVDTGEPRAVAATILEAASKKGDHDVFEHELQGQQLEFATHPRTDLSDLTDEITRRRRKASDHAAHAGAAAVALATSPLPVSPTISPGERYGWMKEHFGLTVQEQLTCGCHVHVSVVSDEEGIAVLDRIRAWLPVLLALSANSPFWQGNDSGYSSYRSRVWYRWPSAGPTELFGSAERYHQQVRAMVDTGVLRDEGMIYFDARLSRTYPTVEIRAADVCLDASSTVLLAALVRALVETVAREWRAGGPPVGQGVGLLRLASWRAGRSGIEDSLIHPVTLLPEPAGQVVWALYDYVRDALEDSGDQVFVQAGLIDLLSGGSGARIQRETLRRTGSLRDVVAACARRTHG